MRLALLGIIPTEYDPPSIELLLSQIQQQLNALSEGVMDATHNAATAAPTTGTYKLGDFIKNSTPSELGTAGSKYIIHGWQCTASGTPGTWLQCRFLTGN